MPLSSKIAAAAAVGLAVWLVPPVVNAQTLNMCGHSVPYKLVPPSPQVQANMQGFLGVWVGTWPSGICNAIVIESIQPDGTAAVLDVFGPDSGKPGGTLRYAGKIVGNTLTSSSRTNAIELTQVSPTQLSASFLSSSAQARGTFNRP
jgi:hypothetical protein